MTSSVDLCAARAVGATKTRFVFVLLGTLVLAGCASKKLPGNANDLGLNNATPGSQQDFTINVGDRVFFETDSTTLTASSRATLDKQAQWLLRYPNNPITIN